MMLNKKKQKHYSVDLQFNKKLNLRWNPLNFPETHPHHHLLVPGTHYIKNLSASLDKMDYSVSENDPEFCQFIQKYLFFTAYQPLAGHLQTENIFGL